MEKTIALFGAKGFVGSELLKALRQANYVVTPISREIFQSFVGSQYDYVINAAMAAIPFKAENDPWWDFRESVEKTAEICYNFKFKKFIQISSISSSCQLDRVYGRHKLAAESLVNDGNNLIIRLGPVYGANFSKGVLMNMLQGKKIYISAESRYSFAPLPFVVNWISHNLDRKGVVEVGAKNSISLGELAKKLNIGIQFEGKDEHKEISKPEGNFPDAYLVVDFMKKQKKIGLKQNNHQQHK